MSGSTVVIGWGLGVALFVLTALGAAMTLVGASACVLDGGSFWAAR